MKVALYLRMSTDKQDTSIPQQREALEKHAAREGYEIVAEYRDEGISGDATTKRKGFQRMIAEAPAGGFDRILCFDQDRFGRFDMIEAGLWISPLRDAGVSLETVAQGFIDWNDFAGRLTYAVAQEGKHQFLRDLSRNCLRGHMAKAATGETMYGGAASYGYRREREVVGRKTLTKLVPKQPEAAVVRKIFETYCSAGGSLLAVGQMLNREQIPPPTPRAPWHRNTIRRMLRNRTYAGDYVWGQTTSGRYHTRAGDAIVPARRGGSRKRAADPIVHEGVLPALVPRELFDKAQELLDSRRKATRRPGTVRPLSGLITCGKCGSPMWVNFGDYRCSRSVDFGDGRRCPGAVARGDELLQAITDKLQGEILTPRRLKAAKEALTKLVAKQAAATTREEPNISKTIAELERQIAEGIARIPLLPKSLVPDMAKGLDAMRQERDSLKEQLKQAKKPKGSKRSKATARVDACIAAAYRLLDKLQKETPSAEVNEALRDAGIRVYFDIPEARVVWWMLEPEKCVKPEENTVLTCDTRFFERHKSKSPGIMVFEVPIVPENKGKRKRRAG